MWCDYCQTEIDSTHWSKPSNKCKRFYADYEKKRRLIKKNSMTAIEWSIYNKREYQRRATYHRYRALMYKDKKRGLGFELTYNQYKILCSAACNWCNIRLCNGVDRLDSDIGHVLYNVVPCCEKCNILLTNLPWECKSFLKVGLQNIRNSGAYDRWTVPYKQCT